LKLPWRYTIPLAIFAAIAVLLGVGLTIDTEEVPSPLIGEPVPPFELAAVEDTSRRVAPGDFEGRVWLLNVWATWCRACRQEHGVLMRAANDHGLTIVGLDYKDEHAAARKWLERRGDPYRVSAFDPEGDVGMDLGVYGVPETYVVDGEGIIRYKQVGPITPEILRQDLLPLLRKLRGGG